MKAIGCTIAAILFAALVGLCGLWVWHAREVAVREQVRTGHTLPGDMPLVKFPARAKYKHPWKITEEYDRFKDCTSGQLEIPMKQLGDKAEIWLYDSYQGKTRLHAENCLRITFHPYVSDFSVLIHGRRVPVYNEPPLISGSGVAFFTIPMADAVEMLQSAGVECRAGEKEFKFTDEQMEALRDWVSRLTP